MSKLVFVADIDIKHSPKVRSEMRKEAVTEYAVLYKKDKKALPLIVLFTEDGRRFLLADGAHRLAAQSSNGAKTVIAEVRKGDYEAALAHALMANERHGIRRSREDKRQCIFEAIKQWPTISNAQIAERCAVDDSTVKSVRDEMEKDKEVKPAPVRESADGRKMPASVPREKEVTSGSRGATKDPSKPVDLIGRAIPKSCMHYWERMDEVKQMLDSIGGVMSDLKKAQRQEDLMFAEVNISGALADLDRTWSSIQRAIPYAVCTQCQGHPDAQPGGQCRMCRGKGLISKLHWDTNVPVELKQILKAQSK